MRRDFVFLALVLGVAAMAAWLLVAQKPSGPTDRQAPPSADESAGAGAVITSMATMPPGEMQRRPRPRLSPLEREPPPWTKR